MSVFQERIQAEIDSDIARHKANGWQVVERPRDGHLIGDFVGAVLKIDDEATARAFYEGYVAWLKALPPGKSGLVPEEVARSNIGWCFGEGMAAKHVAMWVNVCGASHPAFGTAVPTPEQAFRIGVEYRTPTKEA